MQELEEIKVAIVDDEPAGRNVLKTYLEKYCSGIEIVGIASNAKEAAQIVESQNPDLLFLDIEMPGQDGISFLKSYNPVPFEVIFTTAYEKYALKAFELSALHYLLKPFKVEELQLALEKYRKNQDSQLSQERIADFLRHINNQNNRIAIHTSDAIEILEISQIVWCEAESNYSIFHMADGKTWIASRTLKDFTQKLEPFGFVRTHRSHLVNMDYIKKFRKSKSHQLELKDGTTLTLSSGRREEFMQKFSEKFGLEDL